MQAAILAGAKVVLSDVAEMMPLLKLNVEANRKVLAQSTGIYIAWGLASLSSNCACQDIICKILTTLATID